MPQGNFMRFYRFTKMTSLCKTNQTVIAPNLLRKHSSEKKTDTSLKKKRVNNVFVKCKRLNKFGKHFKALSKSEES